MLQTRLQSIPLMALLSINEQQQQQQRGPGPPAAAQQQAGSPTQSTAAGGGGSSSGGGSSAGLDAGAETDQPLSPPFKQQQQVQQRAPLIEERRLVQLFKSRVSGLG